MKKDNDDINKLFRSFGADATEFQELARAADASEAEARWPLLSSVQPGKRELPPLLSKEEKSQSWRAPEQHAQRASKPAHHAAGLSDKLSSSLKRQLAGQPQRTLLSQAASVPEEPNPRARNGLSSKLNQSVPAKREHDKPKGLFSFTGEQRSGTHAKAKSDDALSSVFQRLEQQTDETPAPVLRKGLLGRLGRP